jgi:hypothetical protein
MKTIQDINNEIASIQNGIEQLNDAAPNEMLLFSEMKQKSITTRNKNKIADRIEFLLAVRQILEIKPSEDYLKGEISRLKTLIANLSQITVPRDFYPKDFSGNAIFYFNKKMGITEMRQQIRNIEFILGI